MCALCVLGSNCKEIEELGETSNGNVFEVSHPHRKQPGRMHNSFRTHPGSRAEQSKERLLESSGDVDICGVLSMRNGRSPGKSFRNTYIMCIYIHVTTRYIR